MLKIGPDVPVTLRTRLAKDRMKSDITSHDLQLVNAVDVEADYHDYGQLNQCDRVTRLESNFYVR